MYTKDADICSHQVVVYVPVILSQVSIMGTALDSKQKEKLKSTGLHSEMPKKVLFPPKTLQKDHFHHFQCWKFEFKLLLWQKCLPILRELMEHSPYASLS